MNKIRRGIRMPPQIIVKRLLQMCKEQVERYTCVKRFAKFELHDLLNSTQTSSLDELWTWLQCRPFFANTQFDHQTFITENPEEVQYIYDKAQLALNKQVCLLGSGLIDLGNNINWLKDYKSGFSWPIQYIKDIDYRNPGRPSDVKFPWELSRMQWLIPAGQAYLLNGDERYAELVKEIIEQWIAANPYSYSINWACTMEVAIRIITWSWFFHVFSRSKTWSDPDFRFRFLKCLFLHAEFTEQHLELSDINGNHYTSDLAGLHCAGLFFGKGSSPLRWQELSWRILNQELPRQFFPDGVNFEASIAYHRLVTELFLLPACYREKLNLPVSNTYREYLIKMAEYINAYSRHDGSVPLWGDADDARVIPFGSQKINDHRYLSTLIGIQYQKPSLCQNGSYPIGEIYWWQGEKALFTLKKLPKGYSENASAIAFSNAGFYIMRNGESDHVFIDCGPIGLGGRGGHGHNDCLSFEAMLDGVLLISDSGAYVYTASYDERNLFRSTSYHNTPQIDGEEMNRFMSWDNLWRFHYDAKYQVIAWRTNPYSTHFCGSHTGYHRLSTPLSLHRTINLQHNTHALEIIDDFSSSNTHHYKIPLHLAQNVEPIVMPDKNLILTTQNKQFLLTWEDKERWNMSIENSRISPSYGVIVPSKKILWRRMGEAVPLKILIAPIK